MALQGSELEKCVASQGHPHGETEAGEKLGVPALPPSVAAGF